MGSARRHEAALRLKSEGLLPPLQDGLFAEECQLLESRQVHWVWRADADLGARDSRRGEGGACGQEKYAQVTRN